MIKLYHGSNVNIDSIDLALQYIHPTFQYFFGTERALAYLKKV